MCWLPEGGDAGRREVVAQGAGKGGKKERQRERERDEGRNGDGSRKREETESGVAQSEEESVGRQGVDGRRARIGGGRVMGEPGTWGGSVVRQRAVSRACGWTGRGEEGEVEAGGSGSGSRG